MGSYHDLSTSRSNRRKRAAIVEYNSQYARLVVFFKTKIHIYILNWAAKTYFMPRHERGPFENDTSHLSKDTESASSQRSGSKDSGFLKINSER